MGLFLYEATLLHIAQCLLPSNSFLEYPGKILSTLRSFQLVMPRTEAGVSCMLSNNTSSITEPRVADQLPPLCRLYSIPLIMRIFFLLKGKFKNKTVPEKSLSNFTFSPHCLFSLKIHALNQHHHSQKKKNTLYKYKGEALITHSQLLLEDLLVFLSPVEIRTTFFLCTTLPSLCKIHYKIHPDKRSRFCVLMQEPKK